MATIRGPAWALCTLGSALLILTGCDRFTHSEADWARAALERNPDLTVVAADKDANTFTVQVKGSTELRVIRVDEVIGLLPSDGVAPKVEAETAAAQPASADDPSSTASPGEPATAANDASSASTAKDSTASGTGVIRDSKGNVIASIGPEGVKSPSTEAANAGEATASAATDPAAVSGRVLASGPGYTITAGDPRAARPIRLAEAAPPPRSPVNAQRERRYEPMVCQGNRLLHIDGRNLEFEGDALRALDGCEIHITNSHIIAHGTGISARAANVYVKNSIIEGDSGSIAASEGAKVYTQQSTFKGLSRRLDDSTFTDLGGTVWN
jgi:hypothetical protein